MAAVSRPPATEAYLGDLRTFCLFIGYPKSGGSLISALLDAHPEAAIAQQADALQLVDEGLDRAALFQALLTNSETAAPRGRKQSGYSFVVEGQWQGSATAPTVIGDGAAAKTQRHLERDPGLLDKAAEVVGLPIRLVHIVRNPFDHVARMFLREKKHGMDAAVARFPRRTATIEQLIRDNRYPVHTLRLEDLIDDPHAQLTQMCAFLGLAADEDYLAACSKLIFPSPQRARELVTWRDEDIDAVANTIESHEFLHGYSWDT